MSSTPGLVRYHDVASADGTRLRAWTNDADGPTILLCNGLGTNPYAWPALLRPDCGVRVVSWNHRGVGGSERPTDGRVDLDAFVEDAVAVMDDADIASAPLLAWSAGVTVAFELAYRFPDRVQGILAVAGVPGNTFGTMLAPLHVPPLLARQLMVGLSRISTVTGHGIAPLTRHFPWTRTTTNVLRRTHLIDPAADTAELQAMVKEFFTTHPAWYARLALGVAEQSRVSLSAIDVPTTFVSGRWDLLTGARDMYTASQRVRRSRYRELDATHFIPVEQPEVVLDELRMLLERIEALRADEHGHG